jgi:hypothetical protein
MTTFDAEAIVVASPLEYPEAPIPTPIPERNPSRAINPIQQG